MLQHVTLLEITLVYGVSEPWEMKGRNPQVELNCWRPRLAQGMTQALGVVWPGRAMLTPSPATAQAHVKPGGVQRQQRNSEGARLWTALIQALPQLLLGTALGLPVTPVD